MRTGVSMARRLWLAATAAAGTLALPARTAGIGGGKPMVLVVSCPAGSGADLMARSIAPGMAAALGQAAAAAVVVVVVVVVENRPGAGGTIAAGQVARAAPDGATLLVDASSYAVNPALFPNWPCDPATALVPLAMLALYPNVLVCTPGLQARSVADVIHLARAKPGTLAYASSGNGSAQHLAGAFFEPLAEVEPIHVPCRGGGPALNDVMGGQVLLFLANVASSLGHIRSGRLRPLAVTAGLRCRWHAPHARRTGIPSPSAAV